MELKGTFIQHTDNVFLNIAAKGYDKDRDVRWALSENECIVELRDRSAQKHTIKRLCVTLNHQIDVVRSSIKLLVGFITITVCK